MPEIYGLMAICMVVMDGIEVFTQTGFGAALIYRQENIEEAKHTTFTTNVVRGFILSLIVILIAPIFANYYVRPDLTNVIRILSLSFIIRGFSNINLVILRKELDFKKITFLEIAGNVIYCIIIIILVIFLQNIWALVISAVVSSLTNTVFSFILIPGKFCFRINFQIFKELYSYGRFITGAVIVTFILTQGDNAFVGKVLGMETLGYYVLAFGLANLPVTAITFMTQRIMFPAYSKIQSDFQALQRLYLKVLKFLATFAIPSAAGIGILAPEIVRIVYGAKWLPAVAALQVLCGFGAIRSISATTSSILSAVGKPNIVFYTSAARLIIMASLIYPFTHKYGIVGTSYAILIPIFLEWITGIIYISKTIKLKISNILITIFYPILSSIVMMLSLVFLKNYFTIINIYTLISFIFLGVFAYFLSYSILEYKLLKEFIFNFNKNEA